MHRKYNTTQKNTKQISLESLVVDLGISLDKFFEHYCLLQNCYNSNLVVFNYKNLSTSKYSNFAYMYISYSVNYYDLISSLAINRW
jgi:hypothetical protein